MDLDEKFRVMIASKSFDSFTELSDRIKRFEEETGSVFRFRMSHRYPKNDPDAKRIVYKRCSYVCIHYGNYESKAVHPAKRKTLRSGCAAYFEMKGSSAGVRVVRYSMVHNHAVTMTKTHLHVSRRRLTPSEKVIITDMIRAKADNKVIRAFIRDTFNKLYDPIDISQLRYRLTRTMNITEEEDPNIFQPGEVLPVERIPSPVYDFPEKTVDLDAPNVLVASKPLPQQTNLTDLSHMGFADKMQSAYLSVSQRLQFIFQRTDPRMFPELIKSCDAWLSTIEKEVDNFQPKTTGSMIPFYRGSPQSTLPPPTLPGIYDSEPEDFIPLAEDDHKLSMTLSEAIDKVWKMSSVTDESDDEELVEICLECEQRYPHPASSSSVSTPWIVCQGCRGWFHQICVGVRNPGVFFCRACRRE